MTNPLDNLTEEDLTQLREIGADMRELAKWVRKDNPHAAERLSDAATDEAVRWLRDDWHEMMYQSREDARELEALREIIEDVRRGVVRLDEIEAREDRARILAQRG